jgi:heterodisulfide reductase subunit A-like polyferredoxin
MSIFCPDSGKNLAFMACEPQDGVVDAELISLVSASTGLSPSEAARVVADIVGWYRESVEEYVRRRHAHLRTYGKRNSEIFALVAAELSDRLVAAPELSERQLRRIVYG